MATEERAKGEVVRPDFPDPWQPIHCPLPGCGEDLYVEYQGSRPIFAGDDAGDIASVGEGGAYASSWHIGCVRGHVILTPPDTAQDTYEFGSTARCEPSDSPEPCDAEWCSHGDMERLRAVLAAFGVRDA